MMSDETSNTGIWHTNQFKYIKDPYYILWFIFY